MLYLGTVIYGQCPALFMSPMGNHSSYYRFILIYSFTPTPLSLHEVNIQEGGKTVYVVFKYLETCCRKGRGQAE
jgi:hypothetical protein